MPVTKQPGEHPFLLVRKSDYAALQARASQWPWSEQKEAALEDVETLRVYPESRIDIRAINLARIFSTTALAYLLDPAQRQKYVARIVEHLNFFNPTAPGSITAEITANANKMLWIYGVPTGNAFFQAVLALDIIHDDLPPDQLIEIEAMLRDGPARYFRETNLAWKQGAYAAAAIFALYERDTATYLPLAKQWKEHTLKHISADGVFGGGCGYADARWSFADREYKVLFGDVLAHAGVLPDWYDEPKLGKMMEWLNGYAYTPSRVVWTFGDSGPDRFNGTYQPGNERAYRFSPLAAHYAAWLRDGLAPPGALGSYVTAAEPPAEPRPAPSRVFADGGAWLKETSLDSRSLAGVLWNLAEANDAHVHKETNSVCIAAYGEMLLRAGGYNGWATPEQGFSWEYIHDRAIAGNTALFDYPVPASEAEARLPSTVNDHVKPYGVGITESLLTGVVDSARGESGDAIPNGRHARTLLFIHPADGVAGYYVVFDDLTSTDARTAQVVWHPASARYAVAAEFSEYTWTSNPHGGAEVGLTIYLATPPAAVDLRDGVLANWDRGIVGKYLVSHYPLGTDRRANVATVLFPHDTAHAKADFARLDMSDGELSGATVRQAGITDTVLASDGTTDASPTPGVVVRSHGGWLRQSADGALAAVWLTGATKFASPGFSFECSVPATLFHKNDVVQLTVNGPARLRLGAGQPGADSFDLSAGTHRFAVSKDRRFIQRLEI